MPGYVGSSPQPIRVSQYSSSSCIILFKQDPISIYVYIYMHTCDCSRLGAVAKGYHLTMAGCRALVLRESLGGSLLNKGASDPIPGPKEGALAPTRTRIRKLHMYVYV